MMRALAGAAILCVGLSSSVWAQAAAPAPAPTVFVSTRSPMLDAALFVALAGGAVFAACRTSNRV